MSEQKPTFSQKLKASLKAVLKVIVYVFAYAGIFLFRLIMALIVIVWGVICGLALFFTGSRRAARMMDYFSESIKKYPV